MLTSGAEGMKLNPVRISNAKCGQCSLGGTFPANEALIGPHVSPVSVPPAIGDADFIEITMDRRKSRGTIEVEDHVGVAKEHRLAAQYAVGFAEKSAAAEIPDNRLDPIFRRTRERFVFIGKIDFRLNATGPGRRITSSEHMWKAETAETDIFVVEVGHVSVR